MAIDTKLTVLMPLFNAERYIREAVESILHQNWRDFELLVIDDGSTDRGPEIVASMKDERITLLRNSGNLGVAATLNRGLELARGRYIARMDADDISLPDRLERQVLFMDQHPEIGISGGWVRLFGGGEIPYTCRVPGDSREVAAYMLFENSLWHVTAIMRREAMETACLKYDPLFSRSEDYDLWTRAGQHYRLANLERVLVKVRRHKKSVTRSNWEEMTQQTETIQDRLLKKIGLQLTPVEIAFHHRVGRGYRLEKEEEVFEAEKWLLHLLAANQQAMMYDDHTLKQIVGTVWFRVCANSGPLGTWIWRKWRDSPLAAVKIPVADRLRFVASIAWHMSRKNSRDVA